MGVDSDLATVQCPRCASDRNIGRVAYGWPDAELERAERAGEVVLGGNWLDQDMPTHFCPGCGTRWNAWPNGGIAIPPVGASWAWVVSFAATYRGYEHHEGEDGLIRLHEAAVKQLSSGCELSGDLGDLRGLLYYAFRSDYWNGGYGPSAVERHFIDAVLNRLHEVSDGTVPGPSELPRPSDP